MANQDVKYDFTADLTGIGNRSSVYVIVLYLAMLYRYGHGGVSPASVDAR